MAMTIRNGAVGSGISTVCAFVCAVLAPQTVAAQEIPEAVSLEDTSPVERQTERLTVSPYLWGPDISGTVSIGPLQAPVDLSVADLAGGLEIAAMGHVQYDTGPVFIYLEGIGAEFGDPEFASFANQPVAASAILIESGIGKTIEMRLGDGRRLRVSPYAGVRFVHLQAEVDGPLLVVSGENSWTDPAVGAIVELELSDTVSVIGKADFAGLSITDNTYRSGAIGVQYKPAENLALLAGYRTTRGDFRATSNLSADLEASGPLIGLRYGM